MNLFLKKEKQLIRMITLSLINDFVELTNKLMRKEKVEAYN